MQDRWTLPRVVRILRRSASVACWATLAVAAGMAVGRLVEWRSEWAVSALVFAPYTALAAVGGEIGLLTLRAWKSAIVGAVVVGLAGSAQAGAFIPAQGSADQAALTVMTTNLRLGHGDPQVVVSLAAGHAVDVLAVQELTDSAVAGLHEAGLDRQLPYRIVAPRAAGAGVGLWSREPLTDAAVVPGFGFDPVRARITVAGRTYTVMSFHSKAPLYNGGTGPWESDLRRLSDVMADMPSPLVVAGDFNATRDHRQFRDLLNSNGYRDAADDAGAGLLPTFPADRSVGPIARIDHVVLSGGLVGVNAETAAVADSDHYAVIARVAAR
jgi:endonuclease/exonuclease/phosphatase (EEP) superfamily protein YafD